MKQAFTIFHLNLAYSSIPEEQHQEIIAKSYTPLLDLIEEQGYCIGIELTGWTLSRIADVSPQWLTRFKALISEGRIELIGSGYCQIIGPLVPFEVNVWNQALGLQYYETMLGNRPRLALINEMAYSSGMLTVYQQAGYEGIIMDSDNVALAHGLNSSQATMPAFAEDEAGSVRLPVLWADSILFQQLQRYVHGDIRLNDYLGYVEKRSRSSQRPLSLYCNDAEIFDVRPGRYDTESRIHPEGEWQRFAGVVNALKENYDIELTFPSEALSTHLLQGAKKGMCLPQVTQPIPVKKQAKYNISRWAVTGRDDLWINTMCHRLYRNLKGQETTAEQRRQLCELWSSDLRTHITTERWQKAVGDIQTNLVQLGQDTVFDGGVNRTFSPLVEDTSFGDDVHIEQDPEGILLTITTSMVRVCLNLRRGLAIESMAFQSHGWTPVVGTLHQGYFDSISLGADFYSGITVVELVTQHRRSTDLEWVEPQISQDEEYVYVRASVHPVFIHGTDDTIIKQLKISRNQERIFWGVEFSSQKRPYGTVRTGYLTLLPEAFSSPLRLATRNGGDALEWFELGKDAIHTQPGSTLVSANTGLGGESGEILLTDKQKGILIQWEPSECAVFPMLHFKSCKPNFLARIIFSLSELDETFRDGGGLPGFWFSMSPLTEPS